MTALGFFDGVHIGHRRLFDATRAEAERTGAEPAVFTFSDDVRSFKPGIVRLTGFEEKLARFEESGIQIVYTADFPALSFLSPEEFVSDILVRICGTALAVCGFNFRFGAGAAGDSRRLTALMRESGGDAVVIPPAYLGESIVSSSAIRAAVTSGDMKLAAAMMGRCYSLTSTVEHGRGFGHTEGIPTVNQTFPAYRVIPRFGVYSCRATPEGGNSVPAVTNVGVRPTFGEDGQVNCETHLIGYSGDLYGRRLTVEFRRFLRPEQKFASVDALYEQIRRDRAAAEDETD